MSEPIQDVLYVLKVVAYLNPPIQGLVQNWEEATADTTGLADKIAHEVGMGSTFFEALGKSSPRLADAVHDFVYQISNAHRSITEKDLAREQLIRVMFQPS